MDTVPIISRRCMTSPSRQCAKNGFILEKFFLTRAAQRILESRPLRGTDHTSLEKSAQHQLPVFLPSTTCVFTQMLLGLLRYGVNPLN
jgi:hypothetical protein